VTVLDLRTIYQHYLDCLNKREWDALNAFVDDGVRHNGHTLGVAGYRAMLERDVSEIPDLRFEMDMIVTERNVVASRLRFDCTPTGHFLGLPVNGQRIVFSENVFYMFRGNKIEQVFSVIDKAAIEAQLPLLAGAAKTSV